MITIAIGDVHGCLDQLQRLLAECEDYVAGRPRRLVFLGDLIDRGPDSRGVVELVRELQSTDPEHVVCLAGNHEDYTLNRDDPARVERWLKNGAPETLASFGVSDPAALPDDFVDWVRRLPTYYDDGVRLFVHAGIRPGVPLEQQTRHDLLWIRDDFLDSSVDHGRLVVHGHTPLKGGKPDVRPNRINIDTGAVFGGPLTAAVFGLGTRQAEFIQTD